MDTMLALVDAVRDGISTYATGVICMLLQSLATGKSSQTENSCKVVVAFQKLCLFSGDLLYLIVPQVLLSVTKHWMRLGLQRYSRPACHHSWDR